LAVAIAALRTASHNLTDEVSYNTTTTTTMTTTVMTAH